MRYNNIHPDEIVRLPYNAVTMSISHADQENDPVKRRQYIYDLVKTLYREDQNSQTFTKWICNGAKKLQILAFVYNGRDYYWWDLNSSDGHFEASGLEFYPFFDDPVSFIIFSTREGQSPFIWRENIRIK